MFLSVRKPEKGLGLEAPSADILTHSVPLPLYAIMSVNYFRLLIIRKI